MLDGFRGEIDTFVDTMAERVVQLGGTALGTSQNVSAASKLPPYPTNIHASKDHLGALAERYGTTADLVREAIDQTEEAGDADTSDIFVNYSRSLDKALWFIEAHLQETA